MTAAGKWSRQDRSRLGSWMNRCGVSQGELARRLTNAEAAEPISQRAISNLLSSATKNPRRPTKQAVAAALGIDVAELEAGPRKPEGAAAVAELRIAARKDAGAMARWNEHRATSIRRGEWPGRAPPAVRAYFQALAAVPLARPVAISPTLEDAMVLYLALDAFSGDRSQPDGVQRGASALRQRVWRSLASTLRPIADEHRQTIEDEIEREDAVRADIDAVLDSMRAIEQEPTASRKKALT